MRSAAAVLVLAMALWLLVGQGAGSSEAFDETHYHRPLIEETSANLPTVDVVSYNAAMAPGYHILMAVVLRWSGSMQLVRLTNVVIACLLIAVVFGVAHRHSNERTAALVTLPLAFSSYTAGSAVWLTTDNLGLLLSFGSVGLLVVARPTDRRLLANGALGATATMVRQIHVWTAVPAGVAWVASGVAGGSRLSRWAGAVAPLLPIAIAGGLVLLWGGPLPPNFIGQHRGWNPAGLSFGLALVGMFGVPWLPALLRDEDRRFDSTSLVAAAATMVLASLVPNGFEQEGGRWGGALWELVRRTPTIAGRSPVLSLFACLGAVVLEMTFRRAWRAGRCLEACILTSALVAWMTTQSFNFQVWQRYYEPPILILVGWLVALVPVRSWESLVVLPPALMTIAMAALTLLSAFT